MAPWAAVTDALARPSVKLGAAPTTTVSGAEAAETPEPVPVTVSAYVPGTVDAAVATVSVLVVAPAAMEVGAGVTVMPAGAPVMARSTEPV